MLKSVDKNQSVFIGIDSQCLSYLIDAMTDVSEPTDVLSNEKKALLRMYLYKPDTLHVTPTVLTECAAIRNEDRRKLHESFCNVLFSEVYLEDEQQVERTMIGYQKFHSGKNDCRILSEAVHGGLHVLATYDTDFIKNLSVKIEGFILDKPSVIWNDMGIPKGMKPDKVPHDTNPLVGQDWWKW